MIAAAYETWLTANQRYLSAALALVRSALARSLGVSDWVEEETQLRQSIRAAQAAMPALPALDRLCQLFELSSFERDLLLLCAGMELDARFVRLCALAQADPQRAYPTFSLALAALPNAHWSALTPTAPLRQHHLIDVGPGPSLTLSPLKIDERILHYLTGTQYLDTRLLGLVDALSEVRAAELVPSQQQQVEAITRLLSDAFSATPPPLIQLCGSESLAKQTLAAQACQSLNLKLWRIAAPMVPALPNLDQFCRLWTRETVLNASVLLLDCDGMDAADASFLARLSQLLERTPSLLLITSRDRLSLSQRPVVTVDVQKPTPAEQQIVWQQALRSACALKNNGYRSSEHADIPLDTSLNIQTNIQSNIQADIQTDIQPGIQRLVSQFNLSTTTIRSICTGLRLNPDAAPEPTAASLLETLWQACRIQARPQLDELAQRIDPGATWQDLVLPDAQTLMLQEAAAHVRQRARVYGDWGFAAKGSRGLGISALFAGASGTGKTLAAEVLAQELKLDLYRVDLSSVVSKYIGETEKNLRRVFDAAEAGGVILLFDEADALFGKRSEVKDSRDRYANIEVSYLLQRMECYPGLAILTTNLKSALDTAFLRRIRFVVQFPFPDAKQRADIWRRVFPAHTPTRGLDVEKLARLNIAGGNIRTIALNAAFLAADAEEPVQMPHILQAAKTEYAKLEKPLTESEVAGWL